MDDTRDHQKTASDTTSEAANNNFDEAAELSPEARAAALEAELADHKDRLLRALAETENTRRRAQREREDAIEIRNCRLCQGPALGGGQSAPGAREPA